MCTMRKIIISLKNDVYVVNSRYFGNVGIFVFKGGVLGFFSRNVISSHIRVQMGRELVRLIDLIHLNMFSIHIVHWKSSEKFLWTRFGRSVLKNPLKMAFFGYL